jgi:predicted DNA-binding mobile mystery protein A
MTKETLKLRQLSTKLGQMASLRDLSTPAKGWISEIRRALGMSTRQLAQRLDMSQPAVSQAEKAEVEGRITLGTLGEAAVALDCELVYALVPRVSLEEIRERQARRIATRRVETVAHSMRLERQAVSEEETVKQIEDLARELLASRRLWDEP